MFVSNIVSHIFFKKSHPQSIFDYCSVGRPKHKKLMVGAVEGDHFVGSRAEDLKGLLKIQHAMEHGVVTNWGDMENLWNYVYTDLKVQAEEVSWNHAQNIH